MTSLIGRNLFRISTALCVTLRPVLHNAPALIWSPGPILIQGAIRNYAARRGTRARKERALKAKKTAKKEKPVVISYTQKMMAKKMQQSESKPLLPDDSKRPIATDNVYMTSFYKWPVYDVKTAIQNFKEVHHPTMFDNPKAVLKAYFQLNLSTKKKTQFLERVEGTIELPNHFESDVQSKTVCLFCKDEKLNEEAKKVGAEVAVGIEGIRMFQDGTLDMDDYDVVLSHPDIINDLAPIRGFMSQKFPNIKKGTVAFDVVSLVKAIKKGVEYKMIQTIGDPALGLLHVPIGLVDMEVEKIEENYAAVVAEILFHKPPNVTHKFIDKGAIISVHSNERFLVDAYSYVDGGENSDKNSPKSQKANA